ncbi:MAG: P13 family porin [Treponemataceae bacterium]|nr:P13 family porin [Treponemataceae bacterium]
MKKTFSLFILLFAASFAFADAAKDFQLESYQPEFNYCSYESSDYATLKRPEVSFILNFLVGFGLGSYLQGDLKGGITASIGEVVSFAAFGSGIGLLINDAEEKQKVSIPGFALIMAGTICELGFKIYECVRPFRFSQNNTNNKSLGNSNEDSMVNLDVSPLLDFSNDNYGLLVSLKF